jgi:hypothetical protein
MRRGDGDFALEIATPGKFPINSLSRFLLKRKKKTQQTRAPSHLFSALKPSLHLGAFRC